MKWMAQNIERKSIITKNARKSMEREDRKIKKKKKQ